MQRSLVVAALSLPDLEPTGRDAVEMLAQIPAPRFAPGEKWEYSNSSYVVLAQIAETVSGMPFPAFMKTNVFDPSA